MRLNQAPLQPIAATRRNDYCSVYLISATSRIAAATVARTILGYSYVISVTGWRAG